MGMIDPMVMELTHEGQSTRKMLEIIPEGKLNYKPHPKSMTMGQLASHIAEIPGWADVTLNMDVFEIDKGYKPLNLSSVKEIVAAFDKNIGAAAKLMNTASDAKLMTTWTMKAGGQTLMSMPKIAVLRGFILSHLIHHRAQLGVYLRLNDVALPSVYGPTADETMGF